MSATDPSSPQALRDAALELFGRPGGDRATVREIAALAGVSPALINRHFGSKDGLRAAVDAHVAEVLAAILGHLEAPEPDGAGGLAEAMLAELGPGSPIPRYLARAALDGGEAGAALFARLFEVGEQTLDRLVVQGVAAPGSDRRARAVVLTAHDLALFMLRDHIAGALGADPLSPEGGGRYAAAVLELHRDGLTPHPPTEETR